MNRFIIAAALAGWGVIATPIAGMAGSPEEAPMPLVTFEAPDLEPWLPVHDGVMGGISRGGLQGTDEGTAVFSGELSLANNGGFASVRRPVEGQGLARHDGLNLRVRGDGRTYQLRLRTDGRYDGVAYRALFATTADTWTTVSLPFSAFEPTFRGRILSGVPALDPDRVRQVALMLADKTAGPFRLEIAWITPWSAEESAEEEKHD